MESVAKSYAVRAHQNQKYGENPYEVHLQAVVDNLRIQGASDELLCAGWLHDVLEDTDVQPKEVEELFGPRVHALVWAVTGIGKNRKERNLSMFYKVTQPGMRDAVILKLCDRLANVTECVKTGNANLLSMYAKEWPEFKSHLYGLAPVTLFIQIEAALLGA